MPAVGAAYEALPVRCSALLLALSLWALSLGALSLGAGRAEAQGPERAPDPTPTVGRGFTWGGSAVIPLLLGDVRYASSDAPVPFYSPGGGVMGRIGYELPYGFSALAIVSVEAFSVEAQKALILYRGGLELRWTVDTASAALPFVGVGGDLVLLSIGPSLDTTGGVHANAGIAFAVAWWAQVEVALAFDVIFPGVAFRDTVLALVPSVGGSFFF